MSNSNGIPWQRWENLDFRYEAETWALEAYPEWDLDEVWRRHDGNVDIVFGSTGANVRFGYINYEVIQLFRHGYCVLFAYALAKRLNLDTIQVVTTEAATEAGWTGHVGVVLPDGNILDVGGMTSPEEFKTLVLAPVSSVRNIPLDEMVATLIQEEFREDPMDFAAPMERYLFESWVEVVATEVEASEVMVAA